MKKRIWALYRVSTAKQVDLDGEIPMQKKALEEALRNNPDWVLEKELYERGVSAYKLSLDERQEIQEIQEGAINAEFDVLWIFNLDRLGREDEQIPYFIRFLISDCGVMIHSYLEGEIKSGEHVDDLMNYIRAWSNKGESLKTSMRVRKKLRQMNEAGEFVATGLPYGYDIFDTGVPHHKHDKTMKDMRVNEQEMGLVRLMFDLADTKGWGSDKIADYLNEHGFPTRNGNRWHYNTIYRILTNTLYIGYRRYNMYKTVVRSSLLRKAKGKNKKTSLEKLPKNEWLTQPFNENYVGIDRDVFDRVQKQIEARRKKNKNVNIPTNSKLLLSGIAKCGYCKKNLTVHYSVNTYTKKDGTVSKWDIFRYRCPNGKNNKATHPTSTFSSIKFENEVERIMIQFMSNLHIEGHAVELVKSQKEQIKQIELETATMRKQAEKIRIELEKLNEEILKVIMGESSFSREQLSALISKKEKERDEVFEGIAKLEDAATKCALHVRDVQEIAKDLIDWVAKYQKLGIDEKRIMLSRITEGVYIFKDKVEINFNLGFRALVEGNELAKFSGVSS